MSKWTSFLAARVMIVCILLMASAQPTLGQTPVAKMSELETKLYAAAKKEGEVVYWDTLSLKEAKAAINEFSAKYPGMKVTYFESTTDMLEERYLAEHQAGRHAADLIQIEAYDRFKKAGLLAGFKDLVDDTGYPKKFCTEDFDALSLDHSVYGVAYNTKRIAPKDAPRSWDDLLDPKWKGKIGLEPRMFFFLMNTPNWGEGNTIEYLKKLRGQNPIFTKGSSAVLTLLSAGEFSIAMSVLLHGTIREKAKGSPIAWIPLPAAGRLAPSIIPRYAPHPNAARLFMRWWIGPEGQSFIDKVRGKGNPLPGAGTGQSRVLQELGITDVFMAKSWTMDVEGLRKSYADAVGFSSKKK